VNIQLPTEKTKPTRDLRDKVILLYGQPKIGKSTFCAQADGALFLATEPGLSHLEVFQIPITSWSDFLEACQLIHKGEHEFRTVVVDTIDNLYKFCREHILKKYNMQHESDEGFGKGWELVNGEFHRRLVALSLLPYGLMMVSHAQEKEVKTRTGKAVKIAPTLPNSAQKIVNGTADYILYAEIEEVLSEDNEQIVSYQRVIRTKPSTIYEAGVKLELGQDIPDTLPLDYQAFTDALAGKVPEIATVSETATEVTENFETAKSQVEPKKEAKK
jgi:hypothetical protein